MLFAQLGVVISAALCLLSCRAPEEQALSKFFLAARMGDNLTISGLSVVAFPGSVESWEMVETLDGSPQPFLLPELRRKSEDAEEERNQQFEEYSLFRNENYEDLKTIRDRMDREPDHKFTGRRGEIQAEWERFREKYEDLDRRRQEIVKDVEKELRLTRMSLMCSQDPDSLAGEVVIRQALIAVRTQEQGEKTYRFALRRYNLRSSDGQLPSRWIITSIEEN